jgi:hypothetical protein
VLDLFVNRLERLAAERSHGIRLMLSVAIERAQVSPESRAAVQRIFERTRAAVVLDVEHQLRQTGANVDPARLPLRK